MILSRVVARDMSTILKGVYKRVMTGDSKKLQSIVDFFKTNDSYSINDFIEEFKNIKNVQSELYSKIFNQLNNDSKNLLICLCYLPPDYVEFSLLDLQSILICACISNGPV